MKITGLIVTLLIAILFFEGYFMVNAEQPGSPKDGSAQLPANYKSWAKFLSGVQRPDIKQVREIYVNPVGATAVRGQALPDGTFYVMENYKVKEKADGGVETGPDGKLVRGDLAKIFVMGKGPGWGKDVPENIRTGSWIFSAFGPDGKALSEDFNKCRGCHLPAATRDFVLRYDEYFDLHKAK